ncbi:MAG: hypothetical protein KC502_11000 [Myxococcales bacterium]|nr:hypothetical protein [Myxococcales bacterium]
MTQTSAHRSTVDLRWLLFLFGLALALRWLYPQLPTNLYTNVLDPDALNTVRRQTPMTTLWSRWMWFIGGALPTSLGLLAVHRMASSLAVVALAAAVDVASRRGIVPLDRPVVRLFGVLLAIEPRFVAIGAGDSLSVPVILFGALAWLTLFLGFGRLSKGLIATLSLGYAPALFAAATALFRPEVGFLAVCGLGHFLPRRQRWRQDLRDPALVGFLVGSMLGTLWWLLFWRRYGAAPQWPTSGDALAWLVSKAPLFAGAGAAVATTTLYLVGIGTVLWQRKRHRRLLAVHYLSVLPVLFTSFAADPMAGLDPARYFTILVPPLLLVAAIGLWHCWTTWTAVRRHAGAALILAAVVSAHITPFAAPAPMRTWQADFDFIARTQSRLPKGASAGLFTQIYLPNWHDADTGLAVPHPLLTQLRRDVNWQAISPLSQTMQPAPTYLYLGTTCGVVPRHPKSSWLPENQPIPEEVRGQLATMGAVCRCLLSHAAEVIATEELRVDGSLPMAGERIALHLLRMPQQRPDCFKIGD